MSAAALREDADFAAASAAAWESLCRWLAARADELRAEVRDYPTPIARCDVQLTKLLEHRSGAIGACARLRQLEDAAEGEFPTREAVLAVLHGPPATDDAIEARLRSRLRAALFSRPCPD